MMICFLKILKMSKSDHGNSEGSIYLLPHTVAIALKHPEASWYDPVKQRSTAQLKRLT